MRLNLFLILGLSLLTSAATYKTRDLDLPECVHYCLQDNPTRPGCLDEVYDDQKEEDRCICDTLTDSPLLKCIRDCPEDDQREYGSPVPVLCRSKLFPDVFPDDGAGDDEPDVASRRGSPGTLFVALLAAALVL